MSKGKHSDRDDESAGWQWPSELTDEQMAEFRAFADANLPPGTADELLAFLAGPFPEGVLDAETLKAIGMPSPGDFRESHEQLQRVLRGGISSSKPPPSPNAASETDD